jgi:hypothetical protein
LFASILFALMMNFVTDLYLDIKYHLYWYFDKKEVDWAYLIVAMGQLGVLYIIVNYFPNNAATIKKLIMPWSGQESLVFCSSVFCVITVSLFCIKIHSG